MDPEIAAEATKKGADPEAPDVDTPGLAQDLTIVARTPATRDGMTSVMTDVTIDVVTVEMIAVMTRSETTDALAHLPKDGIAVVALATKSPTKTLRTTVILRIRINSARLVPNNSMTD